VNTVPPVPCDLRVGDKIIYTNPQGLKSSIPFTVTGFSHDPTDVSYNRFVYLDWSCFWFATTPARCRVLYCLPEIPDEFRR
jgi:hypothetical protein